MSRSQTAEPLELWSYQQISEHTGVRAGTLRVWRVRGHLPPADYTVGDYLIWNPDTVKRWWKKRKNLQQEI